jgi:L-iditol 2-dehydrogenase
MNETMTAVMVKEIGSFEIVSTEVPSLLVDEVLVEVAVTGLCRTDLKIIEEGHRDLVLPRIPGEEVVGRIIRKGPAVAGFSIGQRVYVYPGTWCGVCPACRQGVENLCQDMRIMGFHRHGGFAQWVAAPEKSLIPIPEGLSWEEAVFAEPLSCCLNALEKAGPLQGKKVAVWGSGPAGILLCRAARAAGAKVWSIEPDPTRRKRFGGCWPVPDERFDLCVPAVGQTSAYEEALTHLAPNGCLVIFSGLSRGAEILPLDFNRAHYLEQKIVGAYGCCFRHGRQALDLLAGGRVPVKDLISHTLPLRDLRQGLDLVKKRTGAKILLNPQPER